VDVTLADDLTRALSGLRAEAEALMADRVTIRRPTGEATYDEATGLAGQTYTTVQTGVACQFSKDQRGGRIIDAGETTLVATSTRVKFPEDQDVEVGDELTVTTAQHTADEGRVWRVTDIERHTWRVSRTCNVEEVTAPELNA
jgi:hypothetical protein